MGYMRHNGFLMTSQFENHIRTVRREIIKAVHVIKVSYISGPTMNGYYNFAVFPDGSKEGWKTSNSGNNDRDTIKEILNKHQKRNGYSKIDWVELQYGDDHGETKVINYSKR